MATFGTFVDDVSLKASELNSFFDKQTFTPVLKQSNTLTFSSLNFEGEYCKVNKTVFCKIRIGNVTGTGTANNRITLDLPLTAATNDVRVIGSGLIEDDSASNVFRVAVVKYSTTQVAFLAGDSTSLTVYVGQTGGPTLTLASQDQIDVIFVYEAA